MRSRRIGLARAVGLFALFFPFAAFGQNSAVHPALWKVRNGTNAIYLFGTMHILPPALDWESPEIVAAMHAADLFVFEAPGDKQAVAEERRFIIKYGALPRGQLLRDMLTSSEYSIYSTTLRQAGLPPDVIDAYRPWLAGLILGLAYLHPDDLAVLKGAEDDLTTYAQANGKEMRYFETVAEQMELLTQVSSSTQIKGLKNVIASLPRSHADQTALLDVWTKGDAAGLAALIDRYFTGHPEAKQVLIDDRNRIWMPQLRALLNSSRSAFVAVGAAHIGGSGGLIDVLCAEGYSVEQMGNAGAPSPNACLPQRDGEQALAD